MPVAAHLEDAVAALARGEAVVVPTDTVYGVAVAARAPGASGRIFALKDRPTSVAIAVLVADIAQAEELALLDDSARSLADRWWPGPLTLVARRRPAVDLDLGGDPATVGVRCPDHDLLRALAERVGPLATTSANRHGEPTPETAAAAAARLTSPVAVVVDGGRCANAPSTVVDVTTDPWTILRHGAIRADRLLDPGLT